MSATTTRLFTAGFVLYLISLAVEDLVNIPLLGNKLMLPELVFLIWAPVGLLYVVQNKATLLGWMKSRGPLDAALLWYFLAVCCSWVASGRLHALGEVIGTGYLIVLYGLVSVFCFTRFQEMWILFLKTLVISGLIAAVSGICLCGYSVW